MQRGVGVLLRVEHPDQQVDQLDQPVDLEPVLHPDRVEVGQVEQHQPVQRRPRRRGGRPRRAGAGPPASPAARRRSRRPRPPRWRRGRRPAYPDLATALAGQRVEQRGLAAAGGAGERDHGVARRRAAAARRPCRRPGGLVDQRRVEPPAAELDDLVERRQPVGQRRATRRHAATRTASAPPAGRGRPRRSRRRGRPADAAEARRASSSSCAASRSPSAAVGSGAPAEHQVRNRSASPASSFATRSIRSCRAWVAMRADRLVAEDRLEHLLGDRRGAAGDRDLGAGRARRSGRRRRA